MLAAALEQGISPTSVARSRQPVTIDAGGRLWHVNNYEGEYLGPIDLAKAIAAVRQLRLRAAARTSSARRTSRRRAKDLGITTPLQRYFSIGLGAEPATPLDMARAYASFADGGYRIDDSLFGNEPRADRVCLENAHGATAARTTARAQAGTRLDAPTAGGRDRGSNARERRHDGHRHRGADPRA